MSELTSNYNLIKPQAADPIDLLMTNPNWDIIDEKLSECVDETTISETYVPKLKSGAESSWKMDPDSKVIELSWHPVADGAHTTAQMTNGNITLIVDDRYAVGLEKYGLVWRDMNSEDHPIVQNINAEEDGITFKNTRLMEVAAPIESTDAATKGYVDALKPNEVTGSGSITVTIANNTVYEYTGVTTLNMTGNTNKACGFVTFGSSAPSVTVSGFTGSSGDDITSVAASQVWEFNCFKGRIIWKNWSA